MCLRPPSTPNSIKIKIKLLNPHEPLFTSTQIRSPTEPERTLQFTLCSFSSCYLHKQWRRRPGAEAWRRVVCSKSIWALTIYEVFKRLFLLMESGPNVIYWALRIILWTPQRTCGAPTSAEGTWWRKALWAPPPTPTRPPPSSPTCSLTSPPPSRCWWASSSPPSQVRVLSLLRVNRWRG